MLTFDVKRKINTLRDILVGKVPDPKAQVEQITIALIYKFMDDMDIEAAELGGSRKFFAGDYEKYAWTEIMQSENGGQQRANLYAEGIDKMAINPQLPQLFRDIFRGAYVPYRDPETLNMFLKEIGEFSYENSEDLGNAFEYLLSIMGSQGDAGQFRTPRHIIDMIVKLVDPKKNERILDPACGTAGFLISAYKHIVANNKNKNGKSTLTADDKKRLAKNFAGYDISPDMVRLSRVNMYLHGFTKPQISEYDTLTSEEKWDDSYDVILANPPFMTPKGGIIPHNHYRVQAKRAEVLFVDYIAEHLSPTGRAGIIVPEGIVFQSANAYKALRKYLVDDRLLYAVISLPAGVFQPYSGVKTSVLLIDKALAKQKEDILFAKLCNDGFDLGAQRREVKGSEIDEIIAIIKAFQRGEDFTDSPLITLASKEKIAEKDYILVGERYKEVAAVNSVYPMVELGEVCEILRGDSITSKDLIEGAIPVIAGGQQPAYYHSKSNRTGKTITVSGSGAYAGFVSYFETPIFASDCSTIQSCNDKVNISYVYRILKGFQDKIYRLQSGMGQPHVYAKDLKQIKIPLPPLSVQEEIVAEIEGYQKIIDGAKQIVDNYKPTIKIDPEWEITELKNLTNIRTGKIDVNKAVTDGKYPFFTCSKDLHYIDEYAFDCEALLLSGNNATANYDVKYYNGKFNAYQRTYIITIIKPNNILYVYLKIIMDGKLEEFKKKSVGSQTKYLTLGVIQSLPIPLPPLSTQQEIVAQISEEMAIVEQNKRLIEIFEQKIKNKIMEVWGEA